MIINPYARRKIGECFYVVTDMSQSEDLIEQSFQDSLIVREATKQLLDGQIDVGSFCDFVNECCTFDFEEYSIEVESNLSDLEISVKTSGF